MPRSNIKVRGVLPPDVIGMTVKAAGPILEKAGFVWRVSKINGCGCMLTSDGRFDRVNLEVLGTYNYDKYSDLEKCTVRLQFNG